MGLEGFRLGSLLLVLIIVLALFGTKKLRHIGEDLGEAFKSFRKALQETDNNQDNSKNQEDK